MYLPLRIFDNLWTQTLGVGLVTALNALNTVLTTDLDASLSGIGLMGCVNVGFSLNVTGIRLVTALDTLDAVLTTNQCDRSAGKASGPDGVMTTYPSKLDVPVITYIWDGGHGFPPKAAEEIVKFFKSQLAQPESKSAS